MFRSMLLVAFSSLAICSMAHAADPIIIDAPDLAKIDYKKTDGGLTPAPGLKVNVIFRADKEHPEKSDSVGWTYHHHPDLAAWKGRLYVGWSSCAQDEDTGVSREYIRTSTDGENWSPMIQMFPPGVSTPLRIYFYYATNDRMLVISGLRMTENTSELTKGPLVVREIRADHTLGSVYVLRPPTELPPNAPPAFATSTDAKFVEACKLLLADNLFLQQQDYGNLLPPERRIKYNDVNNWQGDAELKKIAVDFGKAMSFYTRADGTMVGLSKRRWVTTSADQGKTWTQPVQPPTLITGMGKVWGQKLNNGKYVLAYDPHLSYRFPLVIVTSDDGITYRNPYVTHGPLPDKRYEGKNKSPGASYVRGLSTWSNDGTFPDKSLWLVYSVHKEEIWLSRIPN